MMRVLAIVQARMGSNRLPGKVLKEMAGHPMIYHTLTKLKKARYVDEVVLATSVKQGDNPLAEYVESLGIPVFRGDEAYVLQRYKETSDLYGGEVIVRVTGDCPLLDPVLVDKVIATYITSDKDYIRLDVPNTYLRGFDVEVFSKEALERVYHILENEDLSADEQKNMYSEHVTYYMYTHPEQFKVGYVQGDEVVDSSYNLSVDTLEEFERASQYIHEQGYQTILSRVKENAYEK